MNPSIKQKLCIGALLAFIMPACAAAQAGCPPEPVEPTPEMIQAARENARDHGFLWRISKDGRTSYLYGTMHIAKFEWTFPGPKVTEAIHATDTIALELDLLDPDIRGRMAIGMLDLRTTTLPEPLVTRMRKLADTVCVPYESVADLIPELQITLLPVLLARWDGLDASYAIDGILAAIGHGTQKTVVSLETPESQLELLQMKTPQETISFVQDALDELDREQGHTYFEQVARIWSDADYAEMSRFEEWCACLDTEMERRLMKRALDDRNPNLADRIHALHSGGRQVFAAVGSLHMFGPLGLPALMERRGYLVERVDLKPH